MVQFMVEVMLYHYRTYINLICFIILRKYRAQLKMDFCHVILHVAFYHIA